MWPASFQNSVYFHGCVRLKVCGIICFKRRVAFPLNYAPGRKIGFAQRKNHPPYFLYKVQSCKIIPAFPVFILNCATSTAPSNVSSWASKRSGRNLLMRSGLRQIAGRSSTSSFSSGMLLGLSGSGKKCERWFVPSGRLASLQVWSTVSCFMPRTPIPDPKSKEGIAECRYFRPYGIVFQGNHSPIEEFAARIFPALRPVARLFPSFCPDKLLRREGGISARRGCFKSAVLLSPTVGEISHGADLHIFNCLARCNALAPNWLTVCQMFKSKKRRPNFLHADMGICYNFRC